MKRSLYACSVCEKSFPQNRLTSGELIRPEISKEIIRICPDWNEKQFICHEDLVVMRSHYLSAIQAPVIMMSQNRREAKDRISAQHDYRINLKAELEIRILHEKIDNLLSYQWEKMMEIEKIHLELLSELRLT